MTASFETARYRGSNRSMLTVAALALVVLLLVVAV